MVVILQLSMQLMQLASFPHMKAMQGQEPRCIMTWIFKIRELLEEDCAFSMRAIFLNEITQHIVYASILAANDAAISELLRQCFDNHDRSFFTWHRMSCCIHGDISAQHTRSLTGRCAARESLEKAHEQLCEAFRGRASQLV